MLSRNSLACTSSISVKVRARNKRLGRLRGMPHHLLGVPCPCRRDLLRTLGNRRARPLSGSRGCCRTSAACRTPCWPSSARRSACRWAAWLGRLAAAFPSSAVSRRSLTIGRSAACFVACGPACLDSAIPTSVPVRAINVGSSRALRSVKVFLCKSEAAFAALQKRCMSAALLRRSSTSLPWATRKSHDSPRHSVRRFGYTALADVAHALPETAAEPPRPGQPVAADGSPGGRPAGLRRALAGRQ